MAKRGGDDGWVLGALLLAGVGTLVYAYTKSGRGENNSPLILDAIEDPIDRVVAALNQIVGRNWVNYGLDYLQARIERTMPGVAGLVNAVLWAEQAYRQTPGAGSAKKQAALRLARGVQYA